MSNHKIEPTTVNPPVENSSNPNNTPKINNPDNSCSTPSSTLPRQSHTHIDNTSVLISQAVAEEVVRYQRRRISELERQVAKKNEKIKHLSTTPPFLPPPASFLHPPSTSPYSLDHLQKPPTPQYSKNSKSPVIQSGQPVAQQSTQPPIQNQSSNPTQPHPSLPQPNLIPPPNPNLSAAMAVMAAAGAPPIPGQVSLQYPFMFHNPDAASMAGAVMGVVPPPPPPPSHAMQSTAPPNPQRAPSTSGSGKSQPDNSDRKQSRYWTPEEHQRFLAAVSACGAKNYGQISELVGTRNAKQVRTHAQKFQKRLEREEARRREAHGNIRETGITTVDAAAAAAAVGALPAVMHPDSIGSASLPRAATAPTSSSSAKDFTDAQRKGTQSESQDGTSSADNHLEIDKDTVNQSDDDHVNPTEAAVAAVAAEAAALGGGMALPMTMPMPSDSIGHISSGDDNNILVQHAQNSKNDDSNGKMTEGNYDGNGNTANENCIQENGSTAEQNIAQQHVSSSASSNAFKTEDMIASELPEQTNIQQNIDDTSTQIEKEQAVEMNLNSTENGESNFQTAEKNCHDNTDLSIDVAVGVEREPLDTTTEKIIFVELNGENQASTGSEDDKNSDGKRNEEIKKLSNNSDSKNMVTDGNLKSDEVIRIELNGDTSDGHQSIEKRTRLNVDSEKSKTVQDGRLNRVEAKSEPMMIRDRQTEETRSINDELGKDSQNVKQEEMEIETEMVERSKKREIEEREKNEMRKRSKSESGV